MRERDLKWISVLYFDYTLRMKFSMLGENVW